MKREYYDLCRVQFITHATPTFSYLAGAEAALKGGCRWVQLRCKELNDDDLIAVAKPLRALCRAHGAVFLLDDRVHLVKRAGADGVHLGLHDMPPLEARKILGDEAIIGGTANCVDDIMAHAAATVDYIGCGPFRFTTTKQNLSALLGVEGYEKIISRVRAANVSLPIVAIGGITACDLEPLSGVGVDGVAVSSSVLGAPDPIAAMRQFVDFYRVGGCKVNEK